MILPLVAQTWVLLWRIARASDAGSLRRAGMDSCVAMPEVRAVVAGCQGRVKNCLP